LIKIKIRITNS